MHVEVFTSLYYGVTIVSQTPLLCNDSEKNSGGSRLLVQGLNIGGGQG